MSLHFSRPSMSPARLRTRNTEDVDGLERVNPVEIGRERRTPRLGRPQVVIGFRNHRAGTAPSEGEFGMLKRTVLLCGLVLVLALPAFGQEAGAAAPAGPAGGVKWGVIGAAFLLGLA